jgi:glucokinase, ROK family protein
MIHGKDQTYARDSNMKAVFSLLSEEELSYSELANKIGLSKPAMTNITSEMFGLNLIKQAEKCDNSKNTLGRKRSYLTINPLSAIVGAIDFSTVTIQIRIADMAGNTIIQRLLPDSEFVTEEVLDKIVVLMNEMLSEPVLEGKQLLAIGLAVSAMVNKDTGKITKAPKFDACKNIDLCEYFSSEFHCAVQIKNDVNLALLSEHRKGKLRGVRDAVLLYVDSGIGGAILIDDKVREGEHGFAGELGLLTIAKDGMVNYLDDICSINAVKRSISENGGSPMLPEHFRFKDVKNAYLSGDKLVVKCVEESAVLLSGIIRNLCRILDCSKVIIAGRVRLLGENYLRKLSGEADEYEVSFTQLGDDGVIVGAVYDAIQLALGIIIKNRNDR